MLIKTRYFGEIDVDDQKIITFDNGLIGFEYLKKFTLICFSVTLKQMLYLCFVLTVSDTKSLQKKFLIIFVLAY